MRSSAELASPQPLRARAAAPTMVTCLSMALRRSSLLCSWCTVLTSPVSMLTWHVHGPERPGRGLGRPERDRRVPDVGYHADRLMRVPSLQPLLPRIFGPMPFARLAHTHVLSTGADAFIAVSLAGSLFFNVSVDAAQSSVILYLVLAMAPFAVVAPFVGPLIDRFSSVRTSV